MEVWITSTVPRPHRRRLAETAGARSSSGRAEEVSHIVVVGLDSFHRQQLESLPHPWHFHQLFHTDELKRRDEFPVSMLLDDGPRALREAPHPVDAVVGYWDFPVSTTLPVLRRRIGLPTPSLESVLACEHKYWSRLRQREALPDLVPEFCAVDPFAEDPMQAITIELPFWLKPVKSLRSHLAFRVDDWSDFTDAIDATRQGIRRYGEPFNEILDLAEIPADVSDVSGNHCIAESVAVGERQCTVEGYSLGDEIVTYGVVDSLRDGSSASSLTRYQYPSKAPESVQRRMQRATESLIAHLGYRDGPFNIEYFWSDRSADLTLLEVNPRLSKSHAPLFRLVDGRYHHEVMVAVALGSRPEMPYRQGRYSIAAKFMHRVYEDGIVTRAPTPEEIGEIESDVVGVTIHVDVGEGDRLSDLTDQDAYSFELAQMFIGADTEEELQEKYEKSLRRLPLEIRREGQVDA